MILNSRMERKNSRIPRWPSMFFVVSLLKFEIIIDLSSELVNYFIQALELLDGINHFVAASTGFIHFEWILFHFIDISLLILDNF